MYVSKRIAVALLAASALAGSATAGANALASDGSGESGHEGAQAVLNGSLAPSVPTDAPLFGVVPGNFPWVLRVGRADLRRDGRLTVIIRGLVIPVPPFTGTPGPVTSVSAGLYCNDSPMQAASSPMTVPLSKAGDATIETRLALPPTCLAPALLIHPNGLTNVYIAATGFTG